MVKQHQKRQTDILTDNPELCERLNPSSWPQKPLLGEIRTNIPGITVKKDQSNIELKTLTMEEIDKYYSATTWTHVYTDGSAENVIRNGGCGVFIKRPGLPSVSLSKPGGRLCSQLQSGTPGTLQCYRGSKTVGKKAPKSRLSHRLPFSIAVLDL